MLASGRFCQASTRSQTLSVMALRVVGETSTPYSSCSVSWISRTDIPSPALACRCKCGVHGDDLLFQFIRVCLMLLHDLRFVLPIPIPWHLDRGFSGRGAHLLRVTTVPAVPAVSPLRFVRLISQFFTQFRLQHRLDRVGEQPGKDPLFPEKVVHRFCLRQFLLHLLGARHDLLDPRPFLLVLAHGALLTSKLRSSRLHSLSYTLIENGWDG